MASKITARVYPYQKPIIPRWSLKPKKIAEGIPTI
jgi:hypothetical protein